MTRSRRLPILATLAGLVTSLALTAPAVASPPDRFDETDPFSFTDTNYCDSGLTVAVNGVFHTTGKIRTTKSGIQYFLEHITVDNVLTGPTGTVVRIHTAYVSKDQKITDNGDGTITIISLLTGPSTAYGADGKAIARDPGQVRFRIVIDLNGTPSDPTDDVEVSSELIKGSTGRSDDYCAAIVPVIG